MELVLFTAATNNSVHIYNTKNEKNCNLLQKANYPNKDVKIVCIWCLSKPLKPFHNHQTDLPKTTNYNREMFRLQLPLHKPLLFPAILTRMLSAGFLRVSLPNLSWMTLPINRCPQTINFHRFTIIVRSTKMSNPTYFPPTTTLIKPPITTLKVLIITRIKTLVIIGTW